MQILNPTPLEINRTKSKYGNFSIPAENANTRSGEQVTVSVPGYEQREGYLDTQWFSPFKKDFIQDGDNVLWIGSCIVEDFARRMDQAGTIDSFVLRFGQGSYSFKSLLLYLRWLFEDFSPQELDQPWEGYKDKQFYLSKRDRERIKLQIANVNKIVIFTGVLDICYDSISQQDLYTKPPLDYLDDDRHKYRRLSLQENIESLNEVIKILQTHVCEDFRITTTPFKRASSSWEGDYPPLLLTHLEKALIRSTINECCPEHYFPMLELITEHFPGYSETIVHVHPEIIQVFIEIFCIWFCNIESFAVGKKDFMKKYNALRKAFTIRYLNTKSFPKGEVAEIPDKLPPQSLTNDEAIQSAFKNLFKQNFADK